MNATVLEVWGDPIAHSLSPALHTAAYARLGWNWSYGRRRVDEAAFAEQLHGLDGRYRGLSLTFPLKHHAFAAADTRDQHADLTGAVNTLVLTGGVRSGHNTDVGGLAADLRAHGVGDVRAARLVGAGATATSALVALAELGAGTVEVRARRPEAAARLDALGARLGIAVTILPMDAGIRTAADVTVSTLPGGADVDPAVARTLADGGGMLYDVVYGHWPTALAAAWERAGGRAADGRGMLLEQAVLQIRLFRGGTATEPLPEEEAVRGAMRAALMGG